MTSEQKDQPGVLFFTVALITCVAASDVAKQHVGKSAAVGVGACLVGLIGAARARWDLKANWWFWVALCIGAALQLPLIFLAPWSDPYLTATGAMAFVIPGFLLALGCVFLAEKVFAGSTRPE
jgi:hypothetical protein